ncbi:uncharacterized protein LOC130688830 [Daphnia carinata]|uniref:uncharacterized protein LOC130688830 n=1 Tax=Daphnia carinata TaxID=120202 RepID=UPI00257AE473|nr:uncharacterized protein LOC130688830 [Daphnia carinata]
MIAIAILLCVTMVASAPLEAPLPFGQSSKGGWGYYTTYTPHENLGYTASYNANENAPRVALNQLPVSPAAFAGFHPYALAGVPGYGLRYFPGSPFPGYYPYGYEDPSENYEFEGNYETKSDAAAFQEEVEDVRGTNAGPQNSGTNTMHPILSTIVNLNRLNIMRLAFRNAMMLVLG